MTTIKAILALIKKFKMHNVPENQYSATYVLFRLNVGPKTLIIKYRNDNSEWDVLYVSNLGLVAIYN